MIEDSLRRATPATRSRNWYRSLVKRALDVAIAVATLVLLSPLLALIAVAIRRDSPGPAFYRGARVGRGGKLFKILKFRTMYETPVSYSGPKVTCQDDPRVTPLGRWLRSTKLNELPQFWNVLVGEMSLVGPRPEDPSFAQHWPAAALDEILSVRPGITSPASVLYRNEETLLRSGDLFRQYAEEVAPDKLRLDQLYVQNCSFCLDLDTLLWTALIWVLKVSSYDPPERLLFVGPINRFVHRYANWFAADFLVTLVAFGGMGLLWRLYGPLNVGWAACVTAALAIALLFSVTGAVLGVNRIDWTKAAPQDVYDLLGAWAIAALLAFGANLLAGVLPSGLVIIASLLSFFGFVAVRYRERLATGLVSYVLRRRAAARGNLERVLIVGSHENARYAASLLRQPGNAQRFQVYGFVDDDLYAQGMRVHGAKVVGTQRDIPNLVAERDIKVIVVADPLISQDQQDSIAEVCGATDTRFVLLPNMADSLGDLCGGSSSTGDASEQAGGAVNSDSFERLAKRGAAPISLKL